MLDEPNEQLSRSEFLNLAGICEASLVVVAFAIGWLVDIRPVQQLYFDGWSFIVGIVATAPLLVVFGVLYWLNPTPLRTIREMLTEMLGPILADCRWFDLILLALMAGLCEEILFRGTLQLWITTHWGLTAAILVTGVLFGFVHAVTPAYAILAAAIGWYLSGTMYLVDKPNLLVPITSHAVYDYFAFLVLIAEYRRGLDRPKAPGEPTSPDDSI